MKIGNIIFKENENSGFMPPEFLNIIPSTLDGIDIELPTLIIGFNTLKEVINGGDNHLSLEMNIELNNNVLNDKPLITWCFSKFEKRDIFNTNIDKFYNLCIKELEKKIKYSFFSILTKPKNRILDLIHYIDSDKDKIIYVWNNRMVYIYENKNVIGLSLDEFKYLGFDTTKIVNRVFRNSEYNYVCEKADVVQTDNELMEALGNNHMLIPMIYCG